MTISKKRTQIKKTIKARTQLNSDSGIENQRVLHAQEVALERLEIERSLRGKIDRDYNLFENVPVSLWEEDYSSVKLYIDNLRRAGIKDFRKYFNNNPEAVRHCVELVKIVDVNQTTLELFEAESKDELLIGLSKVFDKDTYDTFKEQIIALIQGSKLFTSERTMRTLKGRRNDVYMMLAVPEGFEDNWSRVLLSIFDITKRKQAEKELKESREFLEKLNNSLKEVIFTVKMPERIIEYVNMSVEHVFGYRVNECIGKNTAFIYPSDDEYKSFGDKLSNVINDNKDVLYTEHLFRRKDGSIFPVEVTTTFLKEKREITQVISILRDITDRKRADETLRLSEASLATAQRIAHLGNWDWNIKTNELHWSDEIYRIFGLAPQQFKATYEAFLDCVYSEDREFVKNSVNQAIYNSSPYCIDHRIVLPDGTLRFVHEEAEVAYNEAGEPVRMIGTVHDITELKRAEYELRALSRELVEAQELERRSIGHELHDQIGQTLTALQLLLARAAKLPQEGMKAGLSQAQSVVTELMAQIRQISLDLCPTMLDDLGLLPTLLWHFDRFKEQTGVRIDFTHKKLDKPLTQKVNLAAYRIIQEALTNIVRHAGVNEATVQAWTDDSVLHIIIEDHGIGFNPRNLASWTSSGLSGMRERVLSVEGRFLIESTPGIGTTVTAEFPLSDIPQ